MNFSCFQSRTSGLLLILTTICSLNFSGLTDQLLSLSAKAASPQPVPLTAISIKYPYSSFVSITPGPPPGMRMQKRVAPRTPFYAPVGTTNLAFGKPVSSSHKPTIGTLAQLVDGAKESDDTSLIDLGPGLQWAQIDLLQTRHIYGILFWHRPDALDIYLDVIVQVSDDPTFKSHVKTVFNNDQRGEAGLGRGADLLYYDSCSGKLIDTQGAAHRGIPARYVRLYSRGSVSAADNLYTEVEVYGR